MKNIKLICLIGLFMLAGTQTTQAQTKEETIAWIKEKLEKYGGFENEYGKSHFEDVTVSPCKITYTRVASVLLYGKERNSTSLCSFNPSLRKEWKVSYRISGIIADTEVIEIYWPKTLEKSFDKGFSLKDHEPEIRERMIKALLHLATFCEQKKEAF